MKCADIPDQAIIDAINQCIDEKTIEYGSQALWAHIWDLTPKFPEFPERLVRAKLYKMIRAKKISGCTCGCRGDFEVIGQERY